MKNLSILVLVAFLSIGLLSCEKTIEEVDPFVEDADTTEVVVVEEVEEVIVWLSEHSNIAEDRAKGVFSIEQTDTVFAYQRNDSVFAQAVNPKDSTSAYKVILKESESSWIWSQKNGVNGIVTTGEEFVSYFDYPSRQTQILNEGRIKAEVNSYPEFQTSFHIYRIGQQEMTYNGHKINTMHYTWPERFILEIQSDIFYQIENEDLEWNKWYDFMISQFNYFYSNKIVNFDLVAGSLNTASAFDSHEF